MKLTANELKEFKRFFVMMLILVSATVGITLAMRAEAAHAPAKVISACTNTTIDKYLPCK